MNFKWFGPVALLAALVIGDQIRINRPAHKFRLAVEVETPDGSKSASGVVAVHPDRSYSRRGQTRTVGDAIFVDLGGGKNLVALLAHAVPPRIRTGVGCSCVSVLPAFSLFQTASSVTPPFGSRRTGRRASAAPG